MGARKRRKHPFKFPQKRISNASIELWKHHNQIVWIHSCLLKLYLNLQNLVPWNRRAKQCSRRTERIQCALLTPCSGQSTGLLSAHHAELMEGGGQGSASLAWGSCLNIPSSTGLWQAGPSLSRCVLGTMVFTSFQSLATRAPSPMDSGWEFHNLPRVWIPFSAGSGGEGSIPLILTQAWQLGLRGLTVSKASTSIWDSRSHTQEPCSSPTKD